MELTLIEKIRAKKAARAFANRLITENWAEFIPEDWDKTMSDEQIKYALEILPQYGVVQRVDMRWERTQ